MKILLGSLNLSKKRALEKALKTLGIEDFEIKCFKVDSGVSSKPIGFEILRGADNRNQELKKMANEKEIEYDYQCSVEGGFSLDEGGHLYVTTYAIVEDINKKKSTGKTLGLRIRKDMFNYIREGDSLNKLIEKLKGVERNKQSQGITGYL